MEISIENIAREAGAWGIFSAHPEQTESFFRKIVERCAGICEEESAGHRSGFGDHCAIMIRRQLLGDSN